MAFINKLQSKYGIECSYHKITKFEQLADSIRVDLSSYVDKEARLRGNQALEVRNLHIPHYGDISLLNAEGMNHLKYAYTKIAEMSAPIPQSPMQMGLYGLGTLVSDEETEQVVAEEDKTEE